MSEVISLQKNLMKNVLEDAKLNRLRMEGGTFLARIRKEDMCENENYRYCGMFVLHLLLIFCVCCVFYSFLQCCDESLLVEMTSRHESESLNIHM